MAKTIISEGKTTTEAIENGLKQLKASRKDVNIKVIEEETLNIKIAQATESGDVNLLSELLKQQKSLKG